MIVAMVDKQLNYGRSQVLELGKTINDPVFRILDIGAGRGADLLGLKSIFPQAELVGIESYLPNIEFLKTQKIKVISMNMEKDKLPFPDGSFDLIVTNQFLEHTKEIFWIMHETSRLLKVNGHLIVGVPNLASLHNRILLLLGQQPTCIQNASAHVRGFTKTDFNKFLEKTFPTGFSLKGFRGSNFYPFPPILAKPLARIFPNFAWGITMLYQKNSRYTNEYLQYPVKHDLETNFYLGSD